jgi:ABC-type glycerol-3-phosphate transport system substrate-binding protein
MMKLAKVALAAALLSAAAPVAAMAQTTEPVTFTLNNNTEHTLVSLYISKVSTNDWEEDIFGDGTLDAGDSVEVTIDDDLPDCEYDLKATFSDGDDVIVSDQDFCELDGGSIDINE